MTYDDRTFAAARIDDPDHVVDEMQGRLSLDLLRPIRRAIAAHVRSDGMIRRLGPRLELMAPRVPGFRPAMAEEDERPAPCLG
jgi:hypothetical protein